MSYSPVIGFSATISVNDGVSNAQQVFAEPVSITVPFGEVSTVDASNMAMSSRRRVKIVGLTDPGELSFEGIYSKADYLRLVALQGNSHVWIITAPSTGETGSGLTWTCTAFLTKVEQTLELENLVKFKATAVISGDITMGT